MHRIRGSLIFYAECAANLVLEEEVKPVLLAEIFLDI